MEYKHTDIRNPLLRDALIAAVTAEVLSYSGREDRALAYARTSVAISNKIGKACPFAYDDFIEFTGQLARAIWSAQPSIPHA